MTSSRHRSLLARGAVPPVLALTAVVGLGGPACGLEERDDFLVGRPCRPESSACDPGSVCLPHAVIDAQFDRYFCRDEDSFAPSAVGQAPLAYCDPSKGVRCPGRLVCNADRVRVDGGPRRLVCKERDDIFAPPYDGGTSG